MGSFDLFYWVLLFFTALIGFAVGQSVGRLSQVALGTIDRMPKFFGWLIKLVVAFFMTNLLIAFVVSYGVDGLALLISGLLKQVTGQSTEVNLIAVCALVFGIIQARRAA